MRRYLSPIALEFRPLHRRWAKLPRIFALAALSSLMLGGLAAAHGAETNWIWSPQHEAGKVPEADCHFRKTFTGGDPKSAKLTIAGDDDWEVYLNGRKIVSGAGWRDKKTYNISKLVLPGVNVLGIKVSNSKGKTAGLLARVEVTQRSGKKLVVATDDTWKTSLRPLGIWHLPVYRDARWDVAQSLGLEGETAPWIAAEGAPVAAVADGGEEEAAEEASPTPAPVTRAATQATTVAATTDVDEEQVNSGEG